MKFRIIYEGKTVNFKHIEAAAKKINPTAHISWLGVRGMDLAIDVTVSSVKDGKELMKSIYKKLKVIPRSYVYVKGDSFWTQNYEKFLGTQVWSSAYSKVKNPKYTEDFKAFFEAE